MIAACSGPTRPARTRKPRHRAGLFVCAADSALLHVVITRINADQQLWNYLFMNSN